MHSQTHDREQVRIAEQWEGLHCEEVACMGLKRWLAFRTPASLLALHLHGGRSVGVRQGATGWRLQTQARHLDFYAAGHYDTLVSGPGAERSIVVHVPPLFEAAVADEGQWNASLPTTFGLQDRRLENLVTTLFKAPQLGLSGTCVVLVSVAIVDRLFELLRRKTSNALSRIVKRMLAEYIDENLASLDPEQAAMLTGLGRTQFGKAFRETFGMSLHQYVIEQRVRIACRRLLSGGRVTELALDLGFSSHAHFTTVFRRATGQTPREYRGTHG